MQTVTDFLLHTSPLFIYLIVGVVLLLESSGVPILNSTLLLFTGALVSLNHLNIYYLAVAAVAGSTSGACLAYVIGARGGRRILLRLAELFHVDAQKVTLVERWFQKSGIWMVFFSRMLPYARPFACFPAGITQTNFARFFVSAFAGSLIWCLAMLSLGWSLGRRWEQAVAVLQQYTLPTLAGVALLVALYFFGVRTIKTQLRSRFQPISAEVAEEVARERRDLVEV